MKKLPPFLLGLTLLFWGWQTGISVVILALPMAILFEGSRWIQWRWDVSNSTFKRLARITSIIVVILYFLFFLIKSITFIYTLITIFPILFFPLLITQTYSINKAFDIRSLFFWSTPRSSPQSSFLINLEIPYFFLVLVAASMGNQESFWFYGGMFFILSVIFWNVRSQRFSPFLWLLLILIAGSLGFMGSSQLYQLQGHLERSTEQWLNDFFQPDDPLQSNTKIGDLGRLKQSNKIVFRLKMNQGKSLLNTVRQAVYNRYKSSLWIAQDPNFITLKSTDQGTNWLLSLPQNNSNKITIYDSFKGQKSLLKLPKGTSKINQLPVTKLEKNQYGTVRIEGKPTLLNYDVLFNVRFDFEDAPNSTDLEVSKSEKNAIQKVIQELNISNKSDREKIKIIELFFANNFGYSLKIEDERGQPKSLSSFLLTNRSGHCEYFATATTLLLRSVGIPARYVTGYAIHEFSPLERLYLVRSRHAHAWTLAYIDGVWQEIDTTPSNWFNLEEIELPQASWMSNLIEFTGFKIAQIWQWTRHQPLVKYGWWIFPLFIILRQQKKLRKITTIASIFTKKTKTISVSSSSSDFYLIEKVLNKKGLWRSPSETSKQWFTRLKKENDDSDAFEGLLPIISLYYSDRFDPKGITHDQQEQLATLIKSWLRKYS
jgi:transglutaminase-like putative cysteine protease